MTGRSMQHPEEGMIHALLDGELDAETAGEIERHAAQCAECAAAIAEARGLVAASSRILTALDDVPAGVIPKPAVKRPWYSRHDVRAAAAFLLVAGASLMLTRDWNGTSSPTKVSRAVSESDATMAPAETSMITTTLAAVAADSFSAAGSEQNASARMRAATGISQGPAPQSAAPVQSSEVRRRSNPSVEVDIAAKSAPKDESNADARAGARVAERKESPREQEVSTRSQGAGQSDGSRAFAIERDASQRAAATTAPSNYADVAKRAEPAPAAASPPASTAPPAANRGRSVGAAIFNDALILKGVATLDEARKDAPLRLIRADSSDLSRRTSVYQVSPGVQVTLIELQPVAAFRTRENSLEAQREVAGIGAKKAATQPLAPPTLLPESTVSTPTLLRSARINTLSWSDPVTGKRYMLSGHLPITQLEALKPRVVPQSR
ncbi:MAG: zf-HC2 domain-containing protein [Gemmatimonadota bacterium]|nr:zf-HC2 domain-containing protein [Gemmatimonadota bacterium]